MNIGGGERMIEGFMSVWLLAMAFILYMTGWKKQVSGNVSGRILFIGLVMAAALHLLKIPLPGGLVWHGSALGAFTVSMIALITSRSAVTYASVIVGVALAGGLWWWFRYIYSIDPVFVVVHPNWDGPIMAGIVASFFAERFRYQFALIITAAIVSELFLAAATKQYNVMLGSLGWWDHTIAALFITRIVWHMKQMLHIGVRRFGDSFIKTRGGNS